MSRLSDTTQKRLIISGLTALCVVLAVAIFTFIGGSGEKRESNIADNISNNVTVDDIKANDKPAMSVPDIQKISVTETESKASGVENVVLDVSNQQSVEVPITEPHKKPPEPEKPVVKDEKAVKNPEKPPVYEKEQTVVEKKSSEPKSGDKKDGMIYIPGFGWVKDEGGGSKSIKMGNDGDKLTGNKVGQMN